MTKDDEFHKLPPDQRLGDKPLEERYAQNMRAIAGGLDQVLNGPLRGKDRPTGFVLMVFPFDGPDRGDHRCCNYISNGVNRKYVVALMKEMVARFEAKDLAAGRA